MKDSRDFFGASACGFVLQDMITENRKENLGMILGYDSANFGFSIKAYKELERIARRMKFFFWLTGLERNEKCGEKYEEELNKLLYIYNNLLKKYSEENCNFNISNEMLMYPIDIPRTLNGQTFDINKILDVLIKESLLIKNDNYDKEKYCFFSFDKNVESIFVFSNFLQEKINTLSKKNRKNFSKNEISVSESISVEELYSGKYLSILDKIDSGQDIEVYHKEYDKIYKELKYYKRIFSEFFISIDKNEKEKKYLPFQYDNEWYIYDSDKQKFYKNYNFEFKIPQESLMKVKESGLYLVNDKIKEVDNMGNIVDRDEIIYVNLLDLEINIKNNFYTDKELCKSLEINSYGVSRFRNEFSKFNKSFKNGEVEGLFIEYEDEYFNKDNIIVLGKNIPNSPKEIYIKTKSLKKSDEQFFVIFDDCKLHTYDLNKIVDFSGSVGCRLKYIKNGEELFLSLNGNTICLFDDVEKKQFKEVFSENCYCFEIANEMRLLTTDDIYERCFMLDIEYIDKKLNSIGIYETRSETLIKLKEVSEIIKNMLPQNSDIDDFEISDFYERYKLFEPYKNLIISIRRSLSNLLLCEPKKYKKENEIISSEGCNLQIGQNSEKLLEVKQNIEKELKVKLKKLSLFKDINENGIVKSNLSKFSIKEKLSEEFKRVDEVFAKNSYLIVIFGLLGFPLNIGNNYSLFVDNYKDDVFDNYMNVTKSTRLVDKNYYLNAQNSVLNLLDKKAFINCLFENGIKTLKDFYY